MYVECRKIVQRNLFYGRNRDKEWTCVHGVGVAGSTMNWEIGIDVYIYGHEFKQTLGDSEGQGIPVCCSSWGRKELDMT